MSDYRTLLAEQVMLSDNPAYQPGTAATAQRQLATHIPWLCPDCEGTGEIGDLPELRIPSVSCDHPNAPTIADLLRWGENVAKAKPFNNWIDDLGRGYMQGRNDLLAALRTEADQ